VCPSCNPDHSLFHGFVIIAQSGGREFRQIVPLEVGSMLIKAMLATVNRDFWVARRLRRFAVVHCDSDGANPPRDRS
jgi:hypothetical protein